MIGNIELRASTPELINYKVDNVMELQDSLSIDDEYGEACMFFKEDRTSISQFRTNKKHRIGKQYYICNPQAIQEEMILETTYNEDVENYKGQHIVFTNDNDEQRGYYKEDDGNWITYDPKNIGSLDNYIPFKTYPEVVVMLAEQAFPPQIPDFSSFYYDETKKVYSMTTTYFSRDDCIIELRIEDKQVANIRIYITYDEVDSYGFTEIIVSLPRSLYIILSIKPLNIVLSSRENAIFFSNIKLFKLVSLLCSAISLTMYFKSSFNLFKK